MASLLIATGFIAGRSHMSATNPSPPPPAVIVNRISQFEEQIHDLEQALNRACVIE